jgi:cytidyltransferase-like protein
LLNQIAAMQKQPLDPTKEYEYKPREQACDAYLMLQDLRKQPELIEFHEFGRVTKLRRGYMDGCFDLCHAGHYNAVRQARLLTDKLVFGLNSDAEILINKGPPVMTGDERMKLLKSCKWVD